MRIKPEPVESDIPRKRLSDIAFEPGNGNEGNRSLLQSAPKKLKAELIPKEPFAIVDKNTNSSANAVAPLLVGVAVEETRLKIADLQSQISSLQTALDRITYKRRKSKTDLTRMSRYSSDMLRLRREKDDLTASLPRTNMSPTKRSFSRPQMNSNVKPEPSKDYFLPPASYNPVAQTPIASGSNVRLPPSFGAGAMDTDSEGPLPEVMARINGIIPALPQISGEDHFDENGDFHGRGRDLFVGPQAKADEFVFFSFVWSRFSQLYLASTSFSWRLAMPNNLTVMLVLTRHSRSWNYDHSTTLYQVWRWL